MSLFDKIRKNKVSIRENFLTKYKLDNLRKKDKMEQLRIIYKTVEDIINYINENEALKKFEEIPYTNSIRQKAVKEKAILETNKGNYVNAYYEIWDYIDDYADKHDGKICKYEEETVRELYITLKHKMKENIENLNV